MLVFLDSRGFRETAEEHGDFIHDQAVVHHRCDQPTSHGLSGAVWEVKSVYRSDYSPTFFRYVYTFAEIAPKQTFSTAEASRHVQ